MARIGLIAGQGKLPIIFAKAAKASGETVIAFALKDGADKALAQYVDKIHHIEWGQLQKWILLMAMERVQKIVLLGKLKKDIFFKGDEQLDEKARSIMVRLGDRKDYKIFARVAKVLGAVGIQIIDPSPYLKELIPQKGILTARRASAEEKADIEYGLKIAKALSSFDIGQTVIVKNVTALAVEAVEGTDAAIRRAGDISKIGFVMVKVARPNQDMRFDIPLVGLDTLKALISSGGSTLALESGKTLLIDKEEMVALANSRNICIEVI